MKKYKIKIALSLVIMSYIAASSGCDFIVREDPVSIESVYSTSDEEITDSDKEEASEESSKISSDSNSDTEHEKEKDTSSEEKKKDSNTESKSSSSKAASSKATASKLTASKTTSSEVKNGVTGISLDIHEVTLEVGQYKMPIVTMTPLSAANKGEIWTTSDEKIATVDKDGVIRAVSEGKCVVTVTSADNSKVSSKVNVTVKNKPKVEGISVSFSEATIKIGETIMPRVTMTPQNADTLEESWKSSNEDIATVDRYGNITGHSKGTCTITVTSVSNDKVSKDITVTVKESEDNDTEIDTGEWGETYIDGILVVNKTYGLTSNYNPGGLTSECSRSFESLRQGALEDGINIYISSGFRSYEEQKQLHESYINLYGEEIADTFSARAGYSEHQTGLAIDCNIVNDSFIGTPEAEWLAEHCYEYGFIIRYPQDKESITGYKYEPWHIRYVGLDFAKKLHDSGLTIEEYFDIESSY